MHDTFAASRRTGRACTDTAYYQCTFTLQKCFPITVIMKELIFVVVLSCSAFLVVETSTKQKCCLNDEIISSLGKCGNQSLIRMNCTNGRMLLRDIILNGDKVATQDAPGYTFVEDTSQYCIGHMINNATGIKIPVALVCFEPSDPNRFNDIETSGILTLISVIFLLATLAVYTYLPQLRDLQGLCYMCMCISMALGFLSLGILQLTPGFRGQACTITGFLVYSWMMATFFWMNVICINMYRSVKDSTYMKKTEMRQYFWYSCYAWGGTILLLIISIIANFIEGPHWKPNFGKSSCWFSGRAETWFFFYGPIAVLITANIFLFAMSSFTLWRETIKYDVNKLNILKHRFLLSLKLFLVMGISWIFEIASFAHGESHIIWKIMDTFNSLQGVVIFLLLVVFRRRAIQGLAQDNCCLMVTRPLAEKLSPHDDAEDEQFLADDTAEVRLN